MSADSNISQQPWIQRNVLWLAGTFFLGSLALYFISFNGPLSDKQGTWGEFGDYMGGVVNPIIGLCTVWLLTVSLRHNQIALQQAREELALARQAVENSRDMQERTELALQKQIDIADQTRDMANAVALWSHMNAKADLLMEERKNIKVLERQKAHDLDGRILIAKYKATTMDEILELEANRLLSKYSQK